MPSGNIQLDKFNCFLSKNYDISVFLTKKLFITCTPLLGWTPFWSLFLKSKGIHREKNIKIVLTWCGDRRGIQSICYLFCGISYHDTYIHSCDTQRNTAVCLGHTGRIYPVPAFPYSVVEKKGYM